jgi:hypothetical protein
VSTLSPLLVDALGLLGDDLLVHLNETESLATQNAEWSEQDKQSAREVIYDLVHVIRIRTGSSSRSSIGLRIR